MEGATSHVGLSKMEYILLDRAHILPCYVIHLDWDKAMKIISRTCLRTQGHG